MELNFWYPHTREAIWDTFSVLKTLTGATQISRVGQKCAVLTRKIGYLGPKVMFIFRNRNFCQMGIWPVCPGLQISYLDLPEKNSISELWVIFRGSPLFLAVSGHSHFAVISTLNFGPPLTKLGGTVPAIKIWPTMTTDLIWAVITEKRPFLCLAEKCFLAKNLFSPKKDPKFSKRLIFILEKGTFWFAQFFPVVARNG